MKVRISNNVLDEEDWPVYELRFADVAQWSHYDATGQHPETYHEVFDPAQGVWVDFLGAKDVERLVNEEGEP